MICVIRTGGYEVKFRGRLQYEEATWETTLLKQQNGEVSALLETIEDQLERTLCMAAFD